MATAVMLTFSKDSNRVTDDTGRVEIVKSFEEVEGFTGVPGTFLFLGRQDSSISKDSLLFSSFSQNSSNHSRSECLLKFSLSS